MKKIFTFLIASMITVLGFSQAPDLMSYQTALRNNSNTLITNTLVGMQISILQGSPSGSRITKASLGA